MAKSMMERLGNTKTRTLLLFGIIVLAIIAAVVMFSSRKPNPLKTEESKASKIPQITSIPGNVTSEKYQELQEEDNRRRAEEAKKSGGSAVATIIGTRDKDLLAKKDTFGIEGIGNCKCKEDNSDIPTLDPVLAAKLIAQVEANPKDALRLMKTNPGLAKAICQQKPELALKLIENDKEAARIMLKECPAMAKKLAEKNPALLKQLMLEDPELAKRVAEGNPELMKELAEKDPAFMKQLLINHPEVAKKLAEKNPEILQKLMEQDPAFAKQLLLQNSDVAKKLAESRPELMKKLMESDPEFAMQMAKKNPEATKTLLKNDPDFAARMAEKNPELLKELMRNDPEFAKVIAKNNPAVMKKFMLEDPEFARQMAKNNPDMVKDLMKSDPAFASALAASNPTLVKELMKNDPAFADVIAKQNPEMVKKLMLDDPEFAKQMAKNNADMVSTLMEADPAFSKALQEKNPGILAVIENNRGKISFTNDKQRLASLEESRRKQKLEQTQIARVGQLNEQQQKQIGTIITNMEAQSKAAFQAWNEISPQVFVAGDSSSANKDQGKDGDTNKDGKEGSESAGGAKNVLVKAGTILFASLDTTVNTDEPGPIMATITQEGPFKGAKIIGDTQFAAQSAGNNRPEKVILNFASLTSPEFPQTISIKGVAIDPDTARTALASDVDHHYLLRYGTLFASAFMTGYSKVITSQGTVQTTAPATGTTTTTTPPLTGRNQVWAALGEVGKRVGDETKTFFNTPNTITVNAGTGFGLLILSDVSADSK